MSKRKKDLSDSQALDFHFSVGLLVTTSMEITSAEDLWSEAPVILKALHELEELVHQAMYKRLKVAAR